MKYKTLRCDKCVMEAQYKKTHCVFHGFELNCYKCNKIIYRNRRIKKPCCSICTRDCHRKYMKKYMKSRKIK